MKQDYYLYSELSLKRKDNTLQIRTKDNKKRDLPIENINNIYVMNETTFNTSMINIISKYGISIHFFNYYNFYTGSFYPKDKNISGELLVNQVSFYKDNCKRLEIAKEFVLGATDGILRNLRYYNERECSLEEEMSDIKFIKRNISDVDNIESLMGLEGNIHKIYYSAWNKILKGDFIFESRKKQPPNNEINALISFVNSIIYTKVLAEIYMTQLNPTISFLHVPGTKRFSLSLDIAEIFKPLLGDRLIFSLLNKKQITKNHFRYDLNGTLLTKEGSMIVTKELEKVLERTIMHKKLQKKVSYRYLIRLECYKLINHLMGGNKYESFKLWW